MRNKLQRIPSFVLHFPSFMVRIFRTYQYNQLVKRKKFKTLLIHGFPMQINLQDKVLGKQFFIYRDYENYETTLLEQLLLPSMNVIDIGANIGFYSVICGLHASEGQVIAFEPDPTNFEFLQINIQLNHLHNVRPERLAVLDHSDEVFLYLSHANFGDHRTFPSADDSLSNDGINRPKVAVKGISIDEYVAREEFSPDLIKMDIQGAELPALIGMEKTLSTFQPIIFCEYWPHGISQSGYNPIDFLHRLKRLGYRMYEIIEQHRRIEEVLNIDTLTARLEKEACVNFAAHVNLLCIHKNSDELNAKIGSLND